MNTTTISADTLRFVRTEKNLSAAIAQHKKAEASVVRWAEYAKKGDDYSVKLLAHWLETAEAWFLRVAEIFEAENPDFFEAAPVAAEQPVAEKVAAPKPANDAMRVRAMRRFYAVAKAAGLNLKDALGMTWALAKYLGRIVNSRADLSAGQWAEATAATELGLLAW